MPEPPFSSDSTKVRKPSSEPFLSRSHGMRFSHSGSLSSGMALGFNSFCAKSRASRWNSRCSSDNLTSNMLASLEWRQV